MIYWFEAGGVDDAFGSLSKDIRVRVLDCSPTGCLLESAGRVGVGTVAALAVTFGDREFADSIRVVRCQSIVGSSGMYHLGAEFLMTTAPHAGSIRYAMRREREVLAGLLSKSNRQ